MAHLEPPLESPLVVLRSILSLENDRSPLQRVTMRDK